MAKDEDGSKEAKSDEHFAAYAKIVNDADLEDIRLVDLEFSVKPEYYSASRRDSEQNRLKRNFDGQFSNFTHRREECVLGGQFDWFITVRLGKKKVLFIHATYFVTYSRVPDVGHDAPEAFIKRVGKFASYPYFRSLVSQLSWESQAELPVLPVLK